jgi:hypothetical protein
MYDDNRRSSRQIQPKLPLLNVQSRHSWRCSHMSFACRRTGQLGNFPIRDSRRATFATPTPTPTSHLRPGAIHALLTSRNTNRNSPQNIAVTCASAVTANMASKVTIDASAMSKPTPSTAAPIEPLQNDAARLYTHVHPVVILSLYAYKFKAIVADPVPALLGILAPLAVLQIAYVAVCLPPTGETPKVKKSKPGEKKKHTPSVLETGVNGKIVVRWSLSRLWSGS